MYRLYRNQSDEGFGGLYIYEYREQLTTSHLLHTGLILYGAAIRKLNIEAIFAIAKTVANHTG
jgi:hypothetical protein